jgi:hypothetical protein
MRQKISDGLQYLAVRIATIPAECVLHLMPKNTDLPLAVIAGIAIGIIGMTLTAPITLPLILMSAWIKRK